MKALYHFSLLVAIMFIGLTMTDDAQNKAFFPAKQRIPRNAQFGLGILPGFGAQMGIVVPYEIVTAEAMAQLNFTPEYRNHETSFTFSPMIGGSVRVFGLINQVGDPVNQNLDLDIGFRLGPQIKVPYELKMKVEPFLRGVVRLNSGNQAYLEAGSTEPYVRIGMWVQLN